MANDPPKHRSVRCDHGFIDKLCLVRGCPHCPTELEYNTKSNEPKFYFNWQVEPQWKICRFCGLRFEGEEHGCEMKKW